MMKKIFLILSVILLVCSCGVKKKTTAPVPQNYELNALLLDAVVEYSKGNIDMAASMFNSVLEQDKNNACAYYYLSNLYFQKQDVAKAVEYGKQAIEKNDNNIWYKLQLSEMYMAVQDYDNAARLFEKIVKQNPETIEYWQQLARIYYMKQDEKGELATLDKMEERFGVNEKFSMQKYYLYMQQKENKKATQEIEKLAQAYPTNPRYYSILAENKMKEKDYDKAFEYYNKVREIDPDNEDLTIAYVNYYSIKGEEDSIYQYLSKAVTQSNIEPISKIGIIFSIYGTKVDEDSLTFRKTLSLVEKMYDYGDTNECNVYTILNIGYIRLQEYDKAYTIGRKGMNKGCFGEDLCENTLYALSTEGNPEKTIELSDEIIELYPERPLAYLLKGSNQSLLYKNKEAIETLEMGLKLVGKEKDLQSDFYNRLASCYHELNQDEKCFEYYEKILDMNPEDYFVLNNYAYYLSLRGEQLDKAERMIKKALDKYPDNYTFLDTYAWILYKKGEYKQAKEVMDKIGGEKKFWGESYKNHYNEILKKLQ